MSFEAPEEETECCVSVTEPPKPSPYSERSPSRAGSFGTEESSTTIRFPKLVPRKVLSFFTSESSVVEIRSNFGQLIIKISSPLISSKFSFARLISCT